MPKFVTILKGSQLLYRDGHHLVPAGKKAADIWSCKAGICTRKDVDPATLRRRQPVTLADMARLKEARLSLEKAIRGAGGNVPAEVEKKAEPERIDVVGEVDRLEREFAAQNLTTGEARAKASAAVIERLISRG